MKPGHWTVLLVAVAGGDLAFPERTATYAFDDIDTADVFHWPAARLPVRFYADPRGAMTALIRNAITAWEMQFLHGEFAGVLVGDSLQADVIVRWARGVPPDIDPDTGAPVPACFGHSTNPAVVFKDSSASVLHIELSVRAGYADAQVAACMRRLTIHELGHALGLLQHSPYDPDIMNANPNAAFPSRSDRRTVETLYQTTPTVFPPPPPPPHR